MRLPIWVLVALPLISGCDDEVVAQAQVGGPSASPDRRATGQIDAAAAEKAAEKLPTVPLEEADFMESDRSRDPFRSYAQTFVDEARGSVRSQREVLLDQYSIDELKLIAIVGNANPARAMLVDPTGVGHVVSRGQYVGRATLVQPAGGVGASYEVNWRVDRIRDGDVVFVRDDPSNPEAPSATRVVPLRSENDVVPTEDPSSSNVSNEIRDLKQKLMELSASEQSKRRSEGSAESQRAYDPSRARETE